mmetsp:Transcript_5420/g.16166  ORF Transcript_5420/g.16166 Transcript_5420/m.16166 type:complete len:564 (+) Transcript_5420:193-1884(+)
MFNSFRSYMFGSMMLAAGVVAHAVHVKKYFFPSVVYLYKSKVALLACGNLMLALILLIGRVLQVVCLGPLRLREIERLHVRIREAVIETCFAMTVFQKEFNSKFVGMFAILLFLKIFHWLAKDRVEFMEEQPNSPLLQHGRLVSLMIILFFLDVHLLMACASYTMQYGQSMLVLFAFEFAMLTINLLSNVVRYVFLSADLYLDGNWEAKGTFTFYNELLTDMLQLFVLMLAFVYVKAKYTLPLHIIRDIWMTFNKFYKRWADFKRYRRVMSTMNELFEDATEEELAAGDGICIICRDEVRNSAKKLPCGHIFHKTCLQGWLKRQLNCPTCRAVVDVSPNPSQNQRGEQNRDQPENQANAQRRRVPLLQWPEDNFFNWNRRDRPRRFVHVQFGPLQLNAVVENMAHNVAANVNGNNDANAQQGGHRDAAGDAQSEANQGGTAGPSGAEADAQPVPLPLDRLIRIQEQLDLLRNEVRDLLVETTLHEAARNTAADEAEALVSQAPQEVNEPSTSGASASCSGQEGASEQRGPSASVPGSDALRRRLDYFEGRRQNSASNNEERSS